jgi:hypothetical protein
VVEASAQRDVADFAQLLERAIGDTRGLPQLADEARVAILIGQQRLELVPVGTG